MKKEYDFSKGERGKFYRPDAELYLPIYIEPDMMEVLRKFSKKKGVRGYDNSKWMDKKGHIHSRNNNKITQRNEFRLFVSFVSLWLNAFWLHLRCVAM